MQASRHMWGNLYLAVCLFSAFLHASCVYIQQLKLSSCLQLSYDIAREQPLLAENNRDKASVAFVEMKQQAVRRQEAH